MREAIRWAKKGIGRTSPNPMVGAVIVRDNRIISAGYHQRAGVDHAEVDALKKMSESAVLTGDVMYVTLEPCNHHGRTGPCTEAILKSGLRKVVIGMQDPNPNVVGGGGAFLRGKGVEVTIGVLESECSKLNEAYIKFVSTRRPFVIAKSALTMDGWTATSAGQSRWITNERSRAFVHRLRDQVDAVLVGIGTILADDPLLTTRLKNKRGKDPIRVIVDTNLKTPHNAKVITHPSASRTLIMVNEDVRAEALRLFENSPVSIVRCPIKEGNIDLGVMLDILGDMSITSLLVEGGAAIMGTLIREHLIDKFHIFKAPKILGGGDGIPMAGGHGPGDMGEALGLKDISVRRFGDDFLFTGYPVYSR
ncbi:MAG: bifunctional diaminohydroxyphosphoribosylaminopyrimidine deaminase/5-amino-6-(5-phosphoribosylamino)uracil reductase RibD [Deltaproteobacteria bacterium]|nr:bifunctional diaminohydroxyphosphoribosylaminopyrimidine deaminase/5-amino-6-(5-phosphoribosylamino)uracil reductase RibD [Deltaproteobacteria bacterium]